MQLPWLGSPKSKENLGTDGPGILFYLSKPEQEANLSLVIQIFPFYLALLHHSSGML